MKDHGSPTFTEKQTLLKTSRTAVSPSRTCVCSKVGERNTELREALEHQTGRQVPCIPALANRRAAGSRHVEKRARVCGVDAVLLRLREATNMVVLAHFGPIPIPHSRVELSMDEPHFRWIREHGALHIPDVREQDDFPTLGNAGNWPTLLLVPLRQRGNLSRMWPSHEVRPSPRRRSNSSKLS